MKNTWINVFLFTAGAAIGSLATWKLVKTKYERIAQEEIDSVKATWARLNLEESEDDTLLDDEDDDWADDEEDPEDTSVMTDYAALASRYARSSSKENEKEGGGDDEVPYINGPYVITPEDFGDGNCDYDLHCITYYADDILADDWGVELDIEETIGRDSLDHFGDHVEDVVHVRNERLRRDYEVVRDCRTYAEATLHDPLLNMHAN